MNKNTTFSKHEMVYLTLKPLPLHTFSQIIVRMKDTPQPSALGIKARLNALLKGVRSKRLKQKKALEEDKLVRQKFVLSQATRHLNIDKFEPAPLLNKNILDVGCGMLNIGKDLTLRGAEVTAIDINPDVVKDAQAQADKFGVGILVQQAKPEDLVMHDMKFDIILCLDVMEQTPNLDRFLWALNKLLKPGGLIIFSSHSQTWRSFWLYVLLEPTVNRLLPRSYYKFKNFIRPYRLTEVFAKHGFSVTHLRGLTFNRKNLKWEKRDKPCMRYMGTARRAEDI